MNHRNRLNVDIIKAKLHTKLIGKKIIVYEHTASTNDIAWEYANNKRNNGLAVLTEQQSAGRGRRGNKWFSNAGESILCSVLLTNRDYSIESLTLAAAVAASEAITDITGIETRIKWPNDIVISGKKVAGILLESRKKNNHSDYVIGIGINCHQKQEFFDDLKLQRPATSIDLQGKDTVDRNRLTTKLLLSLDRWIEKLTKDSQPIIERWQQLSSQLGHRITVEYNNRQFTGNCIGIDPAAGLILQLDKGGVRMFDAAHTTVIEHI